VITRFQQLHPGVTIEPEWNPDWPTQGAKLATVLAAGTPPDVFAILIADYLAYANKSQIQPISPLVKRDKVDLADIFERIITAYTFRGSLWGLPHDSNAFASYFSKSAYAEAGVAVPSADWKDGKWTFDAYLDAARRLTKTDPTTGVTRWGTIAHNGWQCLLYSNGADFLTADNKKCAMDSAAAIDALQFMQDLIHKYKVAPPLDQMPTNPRDTFGGGRAANLVIGIAPVGNYRADVKSFQWDVAPVPKGKAERGTIYTGAACFLAKDTKNPEEAWALLQHITSKEVLGGGTTLEMLARKSVVASDRFLSPGQAPEHMRVFTDAGNFAKAYPQITNWPDVSNVIAKELDPLWKGERSARETGQIIAQAVNALLQ
jgi:multiple sugar transport system substrate-binding protein